MSTRLLLVLVVFFHLVLAPVQAAVTPPVTREDLVYQISLGPWEDVAKVHLVLKELGPGHYLAEFYGAAQGMWRLLSSYLPERYQSEMVYRDGRLQPLVYREAFMDQGQHWVKEYRFDYKRRRLALRRRINDGPWVKKWEVPLTEPVYDLLSLVYNTRLGTFGPLRGGSTVRVAILPTPKPQELLFRIGKKTGRGLEAMLNYRQPDSETDDHYFIFINPQGVPTLAWTPVIIFGKLAGRLLNPGDIKPGLLPAVARQP